MKSLFAIAAVAVATTLPAREAAACTVPFTVSTFYIEPDNLNIACSGPWLRESNSVDLVNNMRQVQFYCADQTVFSMWGEWLCSVGGVSVDFCVESTGPAQVNLTYVGGQETPLSVNAGDDCSVAEVSGTLGQLGEAAGAARDGDRFDFPGRAGETVKIVLDRDGTGGSDGKVATLEVFGRGGGQLAQRTGQLPLRLQVSLADAGIVVAVREAAAGAGELFRGAFSLSVRPLSGKVGTRLLSPRPDVEP